MFRPFPVIWRGCRWPGKRVWLYRTMLPLRCALQKLYASVPFPPDPVLLGASKGSTMTCNTQMLEKFSVLLIQIDFVCLNFPGVVTEAFFVCLNLKQKVRTLVVGFPTQMVNVGETVYHAHTYLCAIFCLRPALPLTMGRTWGWKILMIRLKQERTLLSNMYFCCS